LKPSVSSHWLRASASWRISLPMTTVLSFVLFYVAIVCLGMGAFTFVTAVDNI
jgi:hypothetical protein